MSTIDKQRIAAVQEARAKMHPADNAAPTPAITDALHALLVSRADDLEGCADGSAEEQELAAISKAIEA